MVKNIQLQLDISKHTIGGLQAEVMSINCQSFTMWEQTIRNHTHLYSSLGLLTTLNHSPLASVEYRNHFSTACYKHIFKHYS